MSTRLLEGFDYGARPICGLTNNPVTTPVIGVS